MNDPNIIKTYQNLTQPVSGIIKSSPGTFRGFHVSSINAALRYFQIFDAAGLPADQAVPKYSFPIPAGASTSPAIVDFDETFFTEKGIILHSGISFGMSTTLATYTAATGTDHIVIAHFT